MLNFPANEQPIQVQINFCLNYGSLTLTHPAITCSKLTIETLEKGVKYVQS